MDRARCPGPSASRRAPRSAELSGELGDGALDGRAQPVAGAEARALDRVDLEPARQAVQRSRQLDGVRDAEGMRRGAHAAHRQGPRPGVEAPDGARRCARLRGVDDDDVLGALPRRPRAPSRLRPARAPRRPRASARARAGDGEARRRRRRASALPTPIRITRGRSPGAGSASRRRCTGRSCARPARSAGAARASSARSTWRWTKPRGSARCGPGSARSAARSARRRRSCRSSSIA